MRLIRRALLSLTLAALWLALVPLEARAQDGQPPGPQPPPGVGFAPQLGGQVPLDLEFVDETGRAVRLGDYFSGRPVLLTMNYYNCPNFCTVIMDSLAQQLEDLAFEPGKDFRVVTVGIDPRETPEMAAARKDLLARYYPRAAGGDAWRFLTGQLASVDQLAAAVGFRYAFDPASGEFQHPAGVVVISGQGVITGYLYGVNFAARDLRLALVEAAQGKIGTPIDQFQLLCYRYDPATGKYTLAAFQALQWASRVTTLGLLGLLAWLWRGELRRPPAGPAAR